MSKNSFKSLIFIHGKLPTKKLALAITLACANKIFSLLPEFFLGIALDLVICKRSTNFLLNFSPFQQLLLLAIAIATVWAAAAYLYYYEMIAWQHCAQTLQHNLRLYLYNKVITHPNIPHNQIGNITTTITEDINHLDKFFRSAAHDIIHLMLGTILIISIYVVYASPLIALAALAPLPIIVLVSRKLQQTLHTNYLLLRNQASMIATTVTNSCIQQNNTITSLEQASLNYQYAALITAQTNAFFNPLISMIIMLGVLITLLLSGYYVFEDIISPGIFSIILLQTQRLLWPFARTAQLIDAYEQTRTSIKRIAKLLETSKDTNFVSIGHRKIYCPQNIFFKAL